MFSSTEMAASVEQPCKKTIAIPYPEAFRPLGRQLLLGVLWLFSFVHFSLFCDYFVWCVQMNVN